MLHTSACCVQAISKITEAHDGDVDITGLSFEEYSTVLNALSYAYSAPLMAEVPLQLKDARILRQVRHVNVVPENKAACYGGFRTHSVRLQVINVGW